MLGKLGFSLSIAMPEFQGFRLKIYENFRGAFKPNANHEKHSVSGASAGRPEKPGFQAPLQKPETAIYLYVRVRYFSSADPWSALHPARSCRHWSAGPSAFGL
ncbi:MAG: hypothetical protein KUL88_14040, partial [Rhizobium sp.]|nr:hypothetical protein [Rhizobium sp.]